MPDQSTKQESAFWRGFRGEWVAMDRAAKEHDRAKVAAARASEGE